MFGKKMRLLVAAAGGALLLLVIPACGTGNSGHHKTHASEVYKSDDGHYYAQSYDPTLDMLVWYLLLNPSNSSAPIINSAGAGGLSGSTWQRASMPPSALTSTGAAVRVDEKGTPSTEETAFEDVEAAAAEGDLVNEDTSAEEAQSNFDATEQTNLDIDNGDVGGDVGDSGGSDGSDGGYDGGGYDGGGYSDGGGSFDGGGF